MALSSHRWKSDFLNSIHCCLDGEPTLDVIYFNKLEYDMKNIKSDTVIAVIGLGYVGLPLAIEFGKKFKTIGFELSETKVQAYRNNIDPAGEISVDEFHAASRLSYTTDPKHLELADFIIVAVPTPVDEAHQPDFSPLEGASFMLGSRLKHGATVVYESTVYPGATEEICIPILEKQSGMTWKRDFFVGYSPERINPGDKVNTLTSIVKVVSGDSETTLERVAQLYKSVVVAGVHRASSIKVAEASKVIENTQRDLNIALINELALIFDRMNIDTTEVLNAAGTKWNFLNFKPGLVGGHCIGVDPYYLTHKAEMLGYHPQVILAGRRINDGMGKFIAEKTVKLMIRLGIRIHDAKINVFGMTFKENCPDIRNSRVPDIVVELLSYGIDVHVHDPFVSSEESESEYGIKLSPWEDLPVANVIIIAVPHEHYIQLGDQELISKLHSSGVIVDVKASFSSLRHQKKVGSYWRL